MVNLPIALSTLISSIDTYLVYPDIDLTGHDMALGLGWDERSGTEQASTSDKLYGGVYALRMHF